MSAGGFLRDAPGPLNNLPGRRPPWIPKKEIEYSKALWQEVENLAQQKGCDITLHDNTSDAYRTKQEGVIYDLNGPNGIKLALTNPTEKPEYQRDSAQFLTAHRLCLPCCDMFNYYCKYRESRSSWDRETEGNQEQGKKEVFELQNAVVHHFNLWSL